MSGNVPPSGTWRPTGRIDHWLCNRTEPSAWVPGHLAGEAAGWAELAIGTRAATINHGGNLIILDVLVPSPCRKVNPRRGKEHRRGHPCGVKRADKFDDKLLDKPQCSLTPLLLSLVHHPVSSAASILIPRWLQGATGPMCDNKQLADADAGATLSKKLPPTSAESEKDRNCAWP